MGGSVTDADDAAAIMAVQNSYAIAIDRRDWVALRACFAPDATISFGMRLQVGTLDEFMAWAADFHDPLGPTLHQISTHQVVFQASAAVAEASCYLHAVLVEAARGSATSVFGRYDDEFIRRRDRWEIRRRRFRPTWLSTSGATEGPRT
ncbi:hypothetical protein CcI49_33930 [Frankia sp. CcI49]|uniref:nuclear transport factor 2 family protein n=1 Tax=unclassified Frankia TaxID=2632575 RepID=UPI0006CA3C17|nr:MULTISPECIES: nuclear transport factor 2 family protein [unclassified Frankia]KPM55985.1 hypothetical protein ACG83_12365 [Frankia sp. R43]ONH52524.1 hypothetical protein CcI49_33930 [Frankia sp. CcI49]